MPARSIRTEEAESRRSYVPRATPLAPAERRAAIIAATLPLVRVHGLAITTRQIAEAAGIAEGTIFGVFPDKDALLRAAVVAAFDAGPLTTTLAAIDRGLPLEARLIRAVEAIQVHLASIWELLSTPGLRRLFGTDDPERRHTPVVDYTALTPLFEPDRKRLRRDPAAAAQAMMGLTLAGSHPAVAGDRPMTAEEIVSLLLDGLRDPSCAAETRARVRRG